MRSIEEKNPKHKARRVALRRLEKQVSGFENAQLDAKELQKARISVQPMSFDDSGPAKFQPSFFAPLPADLLRNPDEIPRDANDPPFFPDFDRELGYFGGNCGPMDRARDLDDFLNNYHGSSFCVKREEDLRGDRRYLGHYNFRRLIGFDDPEWLVTFTSDIRGHPHLWATMVIDINADDRLLQAEALALIRIMIGRLNTSYLVEHMLAPVLLFSSFGPQHGRILQAHYDGEQIVIFKSKVFDFRHQNDAQAKLFAQWALSEPIGDTK